MTRKFLVPGGIDLSLTEIKNALSHIIAGDPGSPVTGQFWFNSVANRWKYRGNSVTHTPLLDTDTLVGDVTGTLGATTIAAGVIVNADVNASAAIAYSKLALANSIVTGDIVNGTILDADINASAGILLSKLAQNPLDRSLHTGSQAASTISDFNTAVRTNRIDQMAVPTTSVDHNNQKLINLADPTNDTDAANKRYVDAAAAGLSWKTSVKAATTANITLSAPQTIDGVSCVANDRVLVKNQTTQSGNGVYLVQAGAWVRTTDADSAGELQSAAVFVDQGTANNTTSWVQTSDNITLGTTSIVWNQFGGATTYTAGNGLTLTGAQFDVGAGTGITVAADTVSVDTAVVMRRFAVNNTAGTTTVVTHNLNTRDVVVEIYDLSTYETVEADVVRTSVNVVTVTFSASQTVNTLRVVVIG